MDSIYHRVSIRKYQDKPVEQEKIEAILLVAMQAPSAANQQPWEFYVVTDKKKLLELSQTSPYAGMTADAPAAIVSVYRKDCRIPAYAEIDTLRYMSVAQKQPYPCLCGDRSFDCYGKYVDGNRCSGARRSLAWHSSD